MGNFFRGLLFGIAIAVLIAPRRGQEMRRLLSERFQGIRGYLSERVQSNPTLQQGANQVTQAANQAVQAVKDTATQAATQAKDTVAKATTQVKETANNVTQQATQAKDNAGNPPQQPVALIQETVSNAVQGATTQRSSSNGKSTDASQDITRPRQTVQPATSSAAMPAGTTKTRSSASDTPLNAIPGMEPEPLSELETLGIHTTGQLLEQTATKEMRTDLAQRIGISAHMLRTLADRADLMRLPGVGREMATLLEEAGVNGTKDLQRRNPEHLYATLIGTQESDKSAALTPTLDQLTQWIAEATAINNATR